MAVTTWHGAKPVNPNIGDVYIDPHTFYANMWTGVHWASFSGEQAQQPTFIPPTDEQLDKFPALKAAWEEFLVIKKVLGV